MKRILLVITFVFIVLGVAAGEYILKDVLPSSVTISSLNASQGFCVEADFGGHVDTDCLTNRRKMTLSGRMERDGVIYISVKCGDAPPERQELVYAGRRFAMHCDVNVDQKVSLKKRCRRSGFADLLR